MKRAIKVSPKIPPAPFVSFYNENDDNNSIKIYLSLNNESVKQKFVRITELDEELLDGIEADDGLYNFDYEIQDGKFEVYRLDKKPTSYADFQNAKILDVRNKISTTDAIFKENVKPNKKYYYMFRSVNVMGIPSNPSPGF